MLAGNSGSVQLQPTDVLPFWLCSHLYLWRTHRPVLSKLAHRMTLHSSLSKLPDRRVGGSQQNPIHRTQADHGSTVAFQFDNKNVEPQVPSSSNTMQAPDVSWTSCGLDADNRRAGPVDEIMSAAAALTSSALCQRLFRNPSLRGAKGHQHPVGGPPAVHQHQSNQPPITARRTEQVCGMPLRRLANEPAVILLLAALPHQLM